MGNGIGVTRKPAFWSPHWEKCPQHPGTPPPQFIVKMRNPSNLFASIYYLVWLSRRTNMHDHTWGHYTWRHKIMITERHNMLVQFSLKTHKKYDLRGLWLKFLHQKKSVPLLGHIKQCVKVRSFNSLYFFSFTNTDTQTHTRTRLAN